MAMGQKLDFKFQLVSDICSVLTRPVTSCTHRLNVNVNPTKSPFVDWYRLLRVEEDAEVDVIRKQYRKLALQLHPDKNKHPKAELAFKLVSEAYSCLSDTDKRKVFNLERWKNLCIECKSRHMTTSSPRNPSNAADDRIKAWNSSTNRSRSCRIKRSSLRDIRDKFKEEVMVIENCLRANNSTPTRESPVFNPSPNLFRRSSYNQQRTTTTQKESPIFNPSNNQFQGYPHAARTRVYSNEKPDMFWYLQTRNVRNNCKNGRGNFDSPIFEMRSESDRGMFRSKSACVRS